MRLDLKILIAVTTLPAWAACAGAGEQVRPEEVDQLRARVEELERTAGRGRIRVEELEERVFLLQDRVESARLALERQRTVGSSVEPLSSGASSSTPGARRAAAPPSLPSVAVRPGSAPPTRTAPSQTEVTVAPDGAVVADGGDAPAEVVIDENYYRRWVDQNGGRRDGATAGRAGRGDPGRGPLPPVVPDSDRLSVAPMPATAPPGTPVPPAEAPEAVRASAPQGDVSPLAMYRAALDAFNQGQYDEAARGLQGFIAAGPDADYMDNAYFWLGECAYGEGKYEEALSQFQKVVREYPDGNKVPDALLKVALSYERLNNVDGAKTVLGQLVSTYPSTDSARRAAERLRALQ